MNWIAQQNGEDQFEAHRYPMVFVNIGGVRTLKISDPAVVRDLYTTHGELTDKRGGPRQLFKPILGASLFFSKNDEAYKIRRKAVAHVFYKDRLADMMHSLKDILAKKCEKWAQLALQNKGKTVIDISTEFQEIFARNIVTITLGEDIIDE